MTDHDPKKAAIFAREAAEQLIARTEDAELCVGCGLDMATMVMLSECMVANGLVNEDGDTSGKMEHFLDTIVNSAIQRSVGIMGVLEARGEDTVH
jgi:hypothetical protein